MFNLKQFLAMSEEEQWDCLNSLGYVSPKESYDYYALGKRYEFQRTTRKILADLAFRLRDEAMEVPKTKRFFHDALYEIQKHLNQTEWATAWWGYAIAQPIHWIAAALEAKEQSK